MITFGYKKWFESILRALIAIGIGIIFIFFGKEAGKWLIQLTGIGILFAGVIPIFSMLTKKKDEDGKSSRIGNILGITTCSLAAFIGLMMILWPLKFESLFRFLIAASIILFCLIQLIALISAMRLTKFASVPLIITGAVLVGAIVVMFLDSAKVIYITTGVLLAIYGVSEIIALFRIKNAEKIWEEQNAQPAAAKPEEPQKLIVTSTRDADYEEVK